MAKRNTTMSMSGTLCTTALESPSRVIVRVSTPALRRAVHTVSPSLLLTVLTAVTVVKTYSVYSQWTSICLIN